ncbi:hypothetical protein C3747_437g8 [Trypanosoma cruzi]|uniref:Uncharacterized protein n=1 Tax=Trypanosoma cruzi TaxID=5693 RepID=A0A2V2UVF4_TRYCR|nr:hypothetical protein C3747_437g8 [Trypanosoma cruzi]RNC52291.1 hypothetical protein TcCL_ESM10500 [Trypanosoma cruzi]
MMSRARLLIPFTPFYRITVLNHGRSLLHLSLDSHLGPLHYYTAPQKQMIYLWRSIVQQLAGSHARREQSALPLKMALDISYLLVWKTSQLPTRILVATESLSAIEAHRAGPLAVRDYVTEEIWIMLLFLVKRGHSVEFMFSPSHCGVPCNEAAGEEAAVASSLPAMGYPNLARGIPYRRQEVMLEGSPGGGRRRVHHTTGARRYSENSITCVRPNVVPRPAALRTTAMRLLPTLR